MKHLLLIIILLIPLALFCASYQFALELYQDGLYEEAIVEFQKVIDEYPTSEEAETSLFYIGESYRTQENWAKAESSFARLMRAYPGTDKPDRYQYYLALMQYEQDKYQEAVTQFEDLIENYPNSQYSKLALVDYVNCYYLLNDYRSTILHGELLVRNYSENDQVPELLLLVAKASFADNNADKGRQIMKQIADDYPQSDARWQMIDLQMELLEKEKGIQAVIIELEKILLETVPRQYEKRMRQRLVNDYLETENYQSAMQNLEEMVEKYNNADDLDELILQYLNTALQLKQYAKVTDNRQLFDKVMRESELKGKYELAIAWGYFSARNSGESQKIVDKLLSEENTGELQSETYYLAGKIAEKKGRYKEAIDYWQKILPFNPENAPQILLDIGFIYHSRFNNYDMTMNYCRQIITNYSNPHYQFIAKRLLADCYSKLGDYAEALRVLESINLKEAEIEGQEYYIKKSIEYIRKYELEDYEQGFKKLLNSLSTYLEYNNPALLQENLAEILAYDLKDFARGASLLSASSPETGYRKALILLSQAEKIASTYIIMDNMGNAGNEKAPYDDLLLEVNTISFNLGDTLPEDRKEEIKIKKLLIISGHGRDVVSRQENYLKKYPDGEAYNEFLLELADKYEADKDTLKLVEAWQNLHKDDRISEGEYFRTQIKLAEYYYHSGNTQAAYEKYSQFRNEITYNQPEVMYHFARVEFEHGSKLGVLGSLLFLIDNVPGFASYNEALLFLINGLRWADERLKAVEYAQYVPEEMRDAEFYQEMADDYLRYDKLEEAKTSLMHIENKDNATLLKLADLQYTTGDYSLALYSYGVLQDKGEQSEIIYQRSGEIYFDQEDYQSAIGQYEGYLELADKEAEGYNQVVVQNIVCHYRIKNRPKAEELEKKYKDNLDDAAKNEIAIAEGIYYTDIDSKKAEKTFNKLLKEELTTDQMIRTYFWRGVLYLKYKNVEKAKEDFSTVAGATNADFVNQAKFKLGLINFSENNFKESLDNYYYVIEHDEDGKLALEAAQNFAKVCKTIEEWEKAIAAYEIILEKWGNQGLEGQTIFDIAFCYYRDKRFQQAIEMFQQALGQVNDRELQAEAQYWIGMSYFEKDEFEQAVTELLKVGYSYESYTQWAASAELQAGEAYQKLNSTAKARRIFERVIEKYGINSQWGELAKQRMQTM
ncbi:MAG: tetratricopeptide repeat protein [Candidatus Stygibacter australis]|nr:tetratricopeptide repeat protein [Candidatus Stygibacter australis]